MDSTVRREMLAPGGKPTTKTAYYLLSTALSPKRFNEVVRSHWDVETACIGVSTS